MSQRADTGLSDIEVPDVGQAPLGNILPDPISPDIDWNPFNDGTSDVCSGRLATKTDHETLKGEAETDLPKMGNPPIGLSSIVITDGGIRQMVNNQGELKNAVLDLTYKAKFFGAPLTAAPRIDKFGIKPAADGEFSTIVQYFNTPNKMSFNSAVLGPIRGETKKGRIFYKPCANEQWSDVYSLHFTLRELAEGKDDIEGVVEEGGTRGIPFDVKWAPVSAGRSVTQQGQMLVQAEQVEPVKNDSSLDSWNPEEVGNPGSPA